MNELSDAELETLIDEATADCYNEDEELTGFAVMLDGNLDLPFETTVLGVTVSAKEIGQAASGIPAICVRGRTGRPFPSSTSQCQTRSRTALN